MRLFFFYLFCFFFSIVGGDGREGLVVEEHEERDGFYEAFSFSFRTSKTIRKLVPLDEPKDGSDRNRVYHRFLPVWNSFFGTCFRKKGKLEIVVLVLRSYDTIAKRRRSVGYLALERRTQGE